MGTTLSLDLVNFVSNEVLALETAVRVQLQTNHYPPIPVFFVPVCLQAIEFANQGKYDEALDLPEGVTDAVTGGTQTTVSKIITWAHLDFFVTPEDYDPEDDYEYYDDDEDLDLDEI